MAELSSKIVDTIKAQSITPKPKWQFKLKESGKWLIIVLLVIFLGLVAALLWYFLAEIDMGLDFWPLVNPLIMGRGPGLILALIILIAVLAMARLRRTKRGYRYNLAFAVILLLVSGIILAGLFNQLGYGQRLDKSFSAVPFYQNRAQFMGAVWQQPSLGRIAGEIIKIDGPTNFIMRDLGGKEWAVASHGAVWRHNMVGAVGLKVKMIGSQFGNSGFKASDIRPWMPVNGGCGITPSGQGPGGCGMIRP